MTARTATEAAETAQFQRSVREAAMRVGVGHYDIINEQDVGIGAPFEA